MARVMHAVVFIQQYFYNSIILLQLQAVQGGSSIFTAHEYTSIAEVFLQLSQVGAQNNVLMGE